MERRLKERLIGAAVLTILAVIFIPMVLDDTEHPPSSIVTTNIPPRPEGEFTSRIVPIPTRAEAGKEAERSAASGPAGPPAASGGEPAPRAEPAVPPATVAAVPAGEEEKAATGGAVPTAEKDKAPPAKPAGSPAKVVKKSADTPERVGLTAWVVQLGSFASEENARALNERLRKSGYSAFVEPIRQDGEQVYRVRVGPELLRSEAQALRDRILAETELEGIVVSYP